MSGGLSQWWVSVSSLGVCHLSQASAQVLRSSCQLLNLNQQVLLGNCVHEVMPPPLLLLRLGPPMLLLVLNRPMTLARAPATEEVRATGTVEDALRTQHNTTHMQQRQETSQQRGCYFCLMVCDEVGDMAMGCSGCCCGLQQAALVQPVPQCGGVCG